MPCPSGDVFFISLVFSGPFGFLRSGCWVLAAATCHLPSGNWKLGNLKLKIPSRLTMYERRPYDPTHPGGVFSLKANYCTVYIFACTSCTSCSDSRDASLPSLSPRFRFLLSYIHTHAPSGAPARLLTYTLLHLFPFSNESSPH